MIEKLTNDHRRFLGAAVAMATADGVLDDKEQAFIEFLCDRLGLAGEARAEVELMLREPPSPEQIAEWSITAQDRLAIYGLAMRMSEADGALEPQEITMLEQLATVLKLTPEDVERAGELARAAESHGS